MRPGRSCLRLLARFLYPVGCLACERPAAVIWAGRMIRKQAGPDLIRDAVFANGSCSM